MPSSQRSDGFSKRWVTATRAMVPLTVMTMSVSSRGASTRPPSSVWSSKAPVFMSPGVTRLASPMAALVPEEAGSALTRMLGSVKKKTRIRERKREVARSALERRAWRRIVIDLALVCRHEAKSTTPLGRGFNRIVARARASLPQLWRKCGCAQGGATSGRAGTESWNRKLAAQGRSLAHALW